MQLYYRNFMIFFYKNSVNGCFDITNGNKTCSC